MAVAAVIFDMDGVLIDSESRWAAVREAFTEEAGGRWHERAHEDMMGMSTPEWSAYMAGRLGIPLEPGAISDQVFTLLEASYRERLPLLPGARDAVERTAACWPLGVASSSGRRLIDLVMDRSGLGRLFSVRVSSDDVPAGKPAPDVYLEAARRLNAAPGECAAIEDSTSGLRSAIAAGMKVIALPNGDFPPAPEAVEAAAVVLGSLDCLTVELIEDGAA